MTTLVRHSFMRPPGPFHDGLVEFAATLSPQSDIAEVGSWTGESALIFLASTNVRSLIMVEPFDPALCQSVLTHPHHKGTTCEHARALVQQDVLDRYPNARLFQMPSVQAAERLAGWQFDMVYIDGCHEEWAVRQDIEAWKPLIKPGGMLAGHDWRNGRTYRGVTRAVRALLGEPDRAFQDSTWVKQL